MTCRNPECRYEFCWLCLQHTTSHMGHANCDQEAFKKMQESAASSKQKLDRYLTYFTHYNAHRNSVANIHKVKRAIGYLLNRLDDKGQVDSNSSLKTITSREILNSAVEHLIDCRKSLQHVYIFAYFIHFIETSDSSIFKLNLENLNNAIEQLSNMLQNELMLRYEEKKQKAAKLSQAQFGFKVSPEQYEKLQKVSPFPESGKIMKKNGMDHNNYRAFMNVMHELQNDEMRVANLGNNPFLGLEFGRRSNSTESRKRKNNLLTNDIYKPIKIDTENFHDFCIKIKDQEKFCRERLKKVLGHIEDGFKKNIWIEKLPAHNNTDNLDDNQQHQYRFSSTKFRRNGISM